MREKLQRFMVGRYGVDQLSKFLNMVTIILLIISIFSRIQIFYIAGLALLIYSYFRTFSRNVSKRYAENEKYLNATYKIRNKFAVEKMHMQQRKIYHFYHCPQCRQKVRVPKGKGKISITCPKCRTEFIKVS